MSRVEKARVVVNMARKRRGKEMRRKRGVRDRVMVDDIVMKAKLDNREGQDAPLSRAIELAWFNAASAIRRSKTHSTPSRGGRVFSHFGYLATPPPHIS